MMDVLSHDHLGARRSTAEHNMTAADLRQDVIKRILVVDDDAGIRTFVSEALNSEGYVVVEAANGAEALAAVSTVQPDLILLDVRMPGVNGWEVLDELRSAAGPQTPVVVTTASYSGQDQALQSGAQGYLAKPFDLTALYECVDLHSRLRLEPGLRESMAP
jgi:CheY-like chemotaxis protein